MRSYRLIRKYLPFIAAGTFIALALLAGSRMLSLSNQLAVTKQQLHAIADSAAAAAQKASDGVEYANGALARARAAEKTRDSLLAAVQPRVVASMAAHSTALQAMHDAPADCTPVVIALRNDADAIAAVAAGYLEAFNNEVAAHENTKADLARARDDLADAQRSLAGLRAASVAVQLPHPSLLSRLLPQAGIGVAAGFTPEGKFATVAGVTLGWKVTL